MPDSTKLNLRLPAALREQATALAAEQGLSLNTFLLLGVRNWVDYQTRRTAPATTARPASRATGMPAKARLSAVPAVAKARSNEPCPCGSGQKYKRCHGRPGPA